MKILINRKPVNSAWGGGNKFVEGFWNYGKDYGVEVVSKFSSDLDAILVIGAQAYEDVGIGINEILSFKSTNPHTKIIYRMNDHNLTKNSVQAFDGEKREYSRFANGAIFVSEWLKDYYLKNAWECSNNTVVYNGVDRSTFKRNENKISNHNGKINIVTHHWSTNSYKGFDVYTKLEKFCEENKDRFTFTYIGKHTGCFKYCKLIPPIFGDELGKELSKYDLYVSASKYESGPNHVLEALACDIPVLLIDKSGGGLEFVKAKNYYSNWESLKSKLLSQDYNTDIDYCPDTMEKCVENYINFIKDLNERL